MKSSPSGLPPVNAHRAPGKRANRRKVPEQGLSAVLFGVVLASALAACLIRVAMVSASAQAVSDPGTGQAAFQRCRACHSLSPSENGRGPTLYHLFGRMAGTTPGYFYSPAMKRSHIVWTSATLERYLANPAKFIPGTTMQFAGVEDRRDIKNLLAYLRQATR